MGAAEDYIRRVASEAPPLTPEQRERIEPLVRALRAALTARLDDHKDYPHRGQTWRAERSRFLDLAPSAERPKVWRDDARGLWMFCVPTAPEHIHGGAFTWRAAYSRAREEASATP